MDQGVKTVDCSIVRNCVTGTRYPLRRAREREKENENESESERERQSEEVFFSLSPSRSSIFHLRMISASYHCARNTSGGGKKRVGSSMVLVKDQSPRCIIAPRVKFL